MKKDSHGDSTRRRYDRGLRTLLTIEAMRQLQDSRVEPDVRMTARLDSHAGLRNVVAAARRDGRQKVGCLVLGRAEDAGNVSTWLSTVAGVPGFTGFAVGRTVF